MEWTEDCKGWPGAEQVCDWLRVELRPRRHFHRVPLSPGLSPHSLFLRLQVKDDSRALTLGTLTLPLARLLTAPELTLDQWFQLSSSGPNSRLYMKLVMRVWRGRQCYGRRRAL